MFKEISTNEAYETNINLIKYQIESRITINIDCNFANNIEPFNIYLQDKNSVKPIFGKIKIIKEDALRELLSLINLDLDNIKTEDFKVYNLRLDSAKSYDEFFDKFYNKI